MKLTWTKITGLLAVIAFIVTAIANIEKFVGFIGAYTKTGSNLIALGVINIPFLRNEIARNALQKTYDDEVCLVEAHPALLNKADYRNGMIVLFARKLEGGCKAVSERTSAAIYSFSGLSYEFVDDISGYKYPGLDMGNLGQFIIATVSETDFIESSILLVKSGKLKIVKRVKGWADDGDGDEMAVLDYTLDGDCLVGMAAGEDRVRVCENEIDKIEPNSLSFDVAFSMIESTDGVNLVTDENLEFKQPCEKECSSYVEYLTRVTVPGRCQPYENISQWNAFSYKFKVTIGTESAESADERVARFGCGGSPNLVLKVDSLYKNGIHLTPAAP